MEAVKDHRHVAYVQVWAKIKIPANVVVVTDTDATEQSQQARDDCVLIASPFESNYDWTAQTPIGVSDCIIEAGKRGTIILSGVVTIKEAAPDAPERRSGSYFALGDTVAGNALPDLPYQPIGTIVQPNLPGCMVGSTYCPTVSIFLCPWLCAATLPTANAQLDVRAMFTDKGYKAFETVLKDRFLSEFEGDALTENLALVVSGVQTALLKGIENGGLRYMLPPM